MLRYVQFTFLLMVLTGAFLLITAFAHTEDVKPEGSPLPEGSFRVTRTYGESRDPFTGHKVLHRGVDMATRMGAEVASTTPGEVVEARFNGSEGNVVGIENASGYTIRFTHLDEILVEKGERVEKGTIVARVGSSGRSTAPHLHYEIIKDGEFINPATTF